MKFHKQQNKIDIQILSTTLKMMLYKVEIKKHTENLVLILKNTTLFCNVSFQY